MRVLFLHQNAPGQFPHLAAHIGADPGNKVVFLGQTRPRALPNVRWLQYGHKSTDESGIHPYLRSTETAVRRGQAVARACLELAHDGFTPDLIVAHPGWGESLFLREVLPRAKIVSYCEMFYHSQEADVGYIPETELGLDGRCRLRIWNATLLLALEAMDAGIAPTVWQRDTHPAAFRPLIDVAHEGVDTLAVCPNPSARFTLPDGHVLAPGDEVVTFVARHLEPYRGFCTLMRALPALLGARPNARAVICGADGTSYGAPPAAGGTWREKMLAECPVDPARVTFVGALPRAAYLSLLQVSALHLYLTIPFVLSWSCIEAMAAGCLILAADVAPVREVIADGETGFLVDGRDPAAVASRAAALLAERAGLRAVAAQARAATEERFSLPHCLARQTEVLRSVL
jgi:glycosyltransferase involved in cell wall biosynthesis